MAQLEKKSEVETILARLEEAATNFANLNEELPERELQTLKDHNAGYIEALLTILEQTSLSKKDHVAIVRRLSRIFIEYMDDLPCGAKINFGETIGILGSQIP